MQRHDPGGDGAAGLFQRLAGDLAVTARRACLCPCPALDGPLPAHQRLLLRAAHAAQGIAPRLDRRELAQGLALHLPRARQLFAHLVLGVRVGEQGQAPVGLRPAPRGPE